ncbi:MAG: cobalamin B12-binding domain-containing protein [Bacilli bacterium]|nr:cobalamin B12-binding domain-containing protein [Bacilli bacterium]MBN2876536.1 cobalamin B12-binding domain-containing protein [Bacilli bacterium]
MGAIIANHYFSLVGFDSYYIGANTPSEDILLAIRALKPSFIALSVTNYYNLFVTKKLTQAIRSQFPNLKIIVGGHAFENPESLKQIEYDYLLKDYKEILAFKKEVVG